MDEVQNALADALTVDDLYQLLKLEVEAGNGDLPAVISYDSNDHWHTQVVRPIEYMGAIEAKWSAYHGCAKEEEDEDGDETPNAFRFRETSN